MYAKPCVHYAHAVSRALSSEVLFARICSRRTVAAHSVQIVRERPTGARVCDVLCVPKGVWCWCRSSWRGHARTPIQKWTKVARFGALRSKTAWTKGWQVFSSKCLEVSWFFVFSRMIQGKHEMNGIFERGGLSENTMNENLERGDLCWIMFILNNWMKTKLKLVDKVNEAWIYLNHESISVKCMNLLKLHETLRNQA